jgi:hypothetical protein
MIEQLPDNVTGAFTPKEDNPMARNPNRAPSTPRSPGNPNRQTIRPPGAPDSSQTERDLRAAGANRNRAQAAGYGSLTPPGAEHQTSDYGTLRAPGRPKE